MQTHNLFVICGGTQAATASTIRILQFVAHVKPWLAKIGVSVDVHKITPQMLRDARLVSALQAKGLTEFPAVKTPRRQFVGVPQITRAYAMVVQDYKRMSQAKGQEEPETYLADARRGMAASGGASAEDIYRDYYARELTFTAAETDQGDEGMTDDNADSMMSKVRDMMQKRTVIDDARTKRSGAYVSDDPGSEKARRQQAEPGGGDEEADGLLIDRLIATATAPVTQDTIDKAFLVEGGSEDAREDLMLNAYWQNQMESM